MAVQASHDDAPKYKKQAKVVFREDKVVFRCTKVVSGLQAQRGFQALSSLSMHSMCPFDAWTGRECCRLAGARYLAFPSASLREASGSLISFDPITPPSWATSQGPVRRRSTGGAALGVWGRHAPQPWSRPRRRAGRRGEQKAVGRHCPSSTPLVGGLVFAVLSLACPVTEQAPTLNFWKCARDAI